MNEIIKKYNSILKNGYVPCRFMQDYTDKSCKLANCFLHAGFNLTNDLLDEFDRKEIFTVSTLSRNSREDTVYLLNNFLTACGLDVKPCNLSAEPDWNEWKIAYLFTDKYNYLVGDYHLVLQEKDGSWSSKHGLAKTVDFVQDIKHVNACGHLYKFYSSFLIKNPSAQKIILPENTAEKII